VLFDPCWLVLRTASLQTNILASCCVVCSAVRALFKYVPGVDSCSRICASCLFSSAPTQLLRSWHVKAVGLVKVCYANARSEKLSSSSNILDRKVSCDKTVPKCLRCTKAKRECEGYGLRLTWPKENDNRALIPNAHLDTDRPALAGGDYQWIHVVPTDIRLHGMLIHCD
jgi:hypothetical protein